MKNCVKLSTCWLLLLSFTLFACMPGDVIHITTRSPARTPSSTPLSTESSLHPATPTTGIETSSIPTATPTLNQPPPVTPTATASPLWTLTATPIPEPSITPSLTPIPPTRQILEPPCPDEQPPPLPNLKIAFIQDGELRLWENGITTSLTEVDSSTINISDDGTIIAFTRNNELWAINSDGTRERLLVSESDFAAMPPTNRGVHLEEFEWIPCTHQLLFNTRLIGQGFFLTDDLYSVDADTLVQKNLLRPGKGGRFLASPNGQQLVAVSPTTITLMNYDGSSPETVLTYQGVGIGEGYLYAVPAWASDSQSLYAAIPAPGFPTFENSSASIWNLPVYGGEAVKLTEFVTAGGIGQIAPDLSLIAYATRIEEAKSSSLILHIIRPDGAEVASFPVSPMSNWSPDATYFTYWSEEDFYISDMTGESFPAIGVGEHVIQLDWINNSQFLVYHGVGDQEKLSLGTIGAEPILIAQGGIQGYSFVK